MPLRRCVVFAASWLSVRMSLEKGLALAAQIHESDYPEHRLLSLTMLTGQHAFVLLDRALGTEIQTPSFQSLFVGR